jgi:hypothetical protein
MIFATAYVPPEGRAVADTLTGLLALLARYGARGGDRARCPPSLLAWRF